MDRDGIIATIRALPDEVERLVAGRTDEELRRRPAPDDWSVVEICCHLRDDGEISVLRIRRLAAEERPTLEPYDQEALAEERNYREADLTHVLPAVRSASVELAGILERLPPEAWQRRGSHPERGAVTIASEALGCADHARDHLAQVSALLAPR